MSHESAVTRVATGAPSCVCDPSIGEPGAPPGGFVAREPARPAAVRAIRRRLREWIGGTSCGEDVSEAVVQVTDEAVTNAVEHGARGEPGTVEVLANVRGCGGGVAVLVHDDGLWRPPAEDPGFRGRGLMLMGRMADRSTITVSAAGTTVRMCWADPSMN